MYVNSDIHLRRMSSMLGVPSYMLNVVVGGYACGR
jgi:hypothetical protein